MISSVQGYYDDPNALNFHMQVRTIHVHAGCVYGVVGGTAFSRSERENDTKPATTAAPRKFLSNGGDTNSMRYVHQIGLVCSLLPPPSPP